MNRRRFNAALEWRRLGFLHIGIKKPDALLRS